MKLDIPFLFKLIQRRFKVEREQKLHDRYCAMLPYMTEKTYKEFDDWKELFQPKTVFYDNRAIDEIMEEIMGGD